MMVVSPIEVVDEDLTIEELKLRIDAIKELKESLAFKLLKQIANGIVYLSYNNMLATLPLEASADRELSTMVYNKGVIGGLEMLFKNLDHNELEFKEALKAGKQFTLNMEGIYETEN